MSKINTSRNLGRELATAVITFHETVARTLGMSAAESRCLGVLNDFEIATPGQLAQATGLTTGAITGIVDRLEKAGYAKREPNPDDRRSLLVRIRQPEKIAQILGPIYGSLSAAMTQMSGQYTPEQLAVIDRYLSQTIDVLKVETEKLRAGGKPLQG
ncbi:MarR family winged helix-turn-helix transcriptional regulator [Asticcacaulis sp.]|uniref:MarR family winged helix-turn-helix transcriptional regulator n=1 Tax=Asticcacaulis sp. TaxID=1872648 RepID=UPI002B806B93|nr:MarR family transcriptional regulator [Asticcacaulis sp.]HTM81285.1 MarR family transcriptional regulator [Asticcacaulis sp.]